MLNEWNTFIVGVILVRKKCKKENISENKYILVCGNMRMEKKTVLIYWFTLQIIESMQAVW